MQITKKERFKENVYRNVLKEKKLFKETCPFTFMTKTITKSCILFLKGLNKVTLGLYEHFFHFKVNLYIKI